MGFNKFVKKYKRYLSDLGELFNIYLVLNGGRLAYLSEIVNFRELGTIKKLFPKLTYTKDSYGRTFIHKDKLPPGNSNDDVWIAKVLGFDCLGIPDKGKVSYTITYFIDDDIDFMASICDDPDKFIDKTDWFQRFADEYIIKMKIDKNIPNILIANSILNRNIDFLLNNKLSFGIFLYNYLVAPVEDMEYYIENCYDWLIFSALKIKELNPIDSFTPLNIYEIEKYEKELSKIVCRYKPQCIKWNKFMDIYSDDPRIIEYNLDCEYLMKKFNKFISQSL